MYHIHSYVLKETNITNFVIFYDQWRSQDFRGGGSTYKEVNKKMEQNESGKKKIILNLLNLICLVKPRLTLFPTFTLLH